MFSTAIECSRCGEAFPAEGIVNVCSRCGGALMFRYDLRLVAENVHRDDLVGREDTFWKFWELLPLSSRDAKVSLGEPYTPVLSARAFGRTVFLKDEGRLPTGTFKARGMAMTVSKLKELDVRRLAIPSVGNAAVALAAYGARAGIETYTFMPADTPSGILKECLHMKAKVYLVDGLIGDAARLASELKAKYKWFDASTNKQPYRFEGYKAMAYEIAEQFNWDLPDCILFPTGGGEGIIGLWKGFRELTELNWIRELPRLVAVQSSGCAPIVDAYNKGKGEITGAWRSPETLAVGLKVPHPYASYLILKAIRDTKGMAVAVDDTNIISSMRALFRMGIHSCPEAASTLAALGKLYDESMIDHDVSVLLCLTGSGARYLDLMELDRKKICTLRRDAETLE